MIRILSGAMFAAALAMLARYLFDGDAMDSVILGMIIVQMLVAEDQREKKTRP